MPGPSGLALAVAVVVSLMAGDAAAERWDMPTPHPPQAFHTVNNMQFAEDVAEATAGGLEITVHPAGSLFPHPEIKNAVRGGQAQIGEFLLSRLANEDPIYEADSVPFLADSYEAARALWQIQRPMVEERLAEQGLMVLWAVPWPPQGLYAVREIETVEDLAGLRFRAYNQATERLAQLVGAVPTQIEIADLAQAFSTGRVESMITSPSTGANNGAWDYLSHYYDIQAWLPKVVIVANEEAFEALDRELQDALLTAAAEAERRGWELSRAETTQKTRLLADNGIIVSEPSGALVTGLASAGATMAGEWAERAGPGAAPILAVVE